MIVRILILCFFFLCTSNSYSQIEETYELSDSVIVIGKRISDDNINQQKIDINNIQSTGFTNYDLFDYLKLIGISSIIDFNTLPYIEGADFNEQEFFINNIPVPFQSRLIGLQSGLNSLLFSKISLIEAHSFNNFSKPIKLKATTNDIDTSQILFKSIINFLHLENMLSFPLRSLNCEILLGYNRSFLESIRPFLSNFSQKSNFDFNQFPFFQSFQILSNYKAPSMSIKPLFIYSEDKGIVGISSKKFDFHSKQFNSGTNIEFELNKITQSFQLFINAGKNNVDYKFFKTDNGKITGLASLSFLEYGMGSNTIYDINPSQKLKLSFLFKHQNQNSENSISFENNYQSASYSTEYLASKIYFTNIFSDRITSTLYAGLNTNKFDHFNPSFGIDITYCNPNLIDGRFQINYESDQYPINPIFFSFQNTVWNPSSSSGLFFVDNRDLPLDAVHSFNTSLNLIKRFYTQFIEATVSVKFFFRHLDNLLYANSYPDEVTIYNCDFKFKQHFSGARYGLSILFKNQFKQLSLLNQISITLTRSINYDNLRKINFNSLNYNPIVITNLTQYQIHNLFVNFFLIYTSGRFLFNRKIDSYYSSIDTSYNYSISTDYSKQFQLNPYFRADVSLFYKLIRGNFNINVGFSLLNIFDRQNESNRNFSIDIPEVKLNSKSDYFNLPRFIVFELSFCFVL